MNPASEIPVETHEPHWLTRGAFQMLILLLAISQVSIGFAVHRGCYWLAVPLVFCSSHFMHGMLVGFHEASHGLLRKRRLLNEIDGLFIGTLSLMSFSLYRAAHQRHHAYLASERDEELWPFVHPRVSRMGRIFAAFLELTMGMLFTPFLFARAFLRQGSPIRNRKLRQRVWAEYALIVVVWAVILTTVAVLGLWKYFLWLHVIPAWLAGNMQSLRKYIEHVGLTGATVNASTRSIVAEGWMAKFFTLTLLHEPYHGVHHWRSGIPHAELPRHSAALDPAGPGERPPFRTYRAALYDLFVNLADPRVGPQWLGGTISKQKESAERGMN